jgi:hypothetical protein
MAASVNERPPEPLLCNITVFVILLDKNLPLRFTGGMSLETPPTRPRARASLAFQTFTQTLALAAVALSAFMPLAHAALITGSIYFDGQVVVNNGGGGLETALTGWGTTTNAGGSGSFATVPVGTIPSFAPGTWNFNSSVAIPNFWTAGGFSFELMGSSITLDQQNFELVGFNNAVVSGNGYTPTVCSGYFQFNGPTVGGFTPLAFVCDSTGVSAAPVLPVLTITNISKKRILMWTNTGYSLQTAASLTNTFTNIPNATSPYTNTFTTPMRFFRLAQ